MLILITANILDMVLHLIDMKLFHLHHNGANSYLFINDVEIPKFKAKNSEINAIQLRLGSTSKDLSVHNMKKTGLNGCL